MPIVEASGARILVTGANGYIAYWIIRYLLEQGYSVRAAVRSLDKGKHLKETYSSYGDKLELVAVEDITKPGAFDDAVKGVDAIIHTATASDFSKVEVEDYFKPAVDGTVGILESARKSGDKIKRVIVTSSVAAVGFTLAPPTMTFDESNWNDEAVDFVEAKGRDAPGMVKYSASKVLAEKAAWDFYAKHKDELRWELVTILPSHVLGSDDELKATFNYIHIQDIALAHIAALKKEKAGGERIIVSAVCTGASTWQAARNLSHHLKPELYSKGILPRGNPALDTTVSFIHDGEKGKAILGLEYANEEKVIKDALTDFEARGYFDKPANA